MGSILSAAPGVDIDRFFYGVAPELVDPQRFELANGGATKASNMYAFGVLAWKASPMPGVPPANCPTECGFFAGRAPFSDEGRVAGIYSMLSGRRPPHPDHPELSHRV